MKRIVGAALLILCSSVATLAGSPSLSQLQPGERFHVAYHSRGCFHDRKYDIDFERGTSSVTARSAGHAVPLSVGEIAGLDHLIAFYSSRPRGGCTTQDDITITRFHDGRKISSEHYVDGSCATYQMKDITTFYQVAKKLGLEHETKT
jgi:hypothetical protein